MYNGLTNCQAVTRRGVPLERGDDLTGMADWPEWLWVCDRLPLSTEMEEGSSDTAGDQREV